MYNQITRLQSQRQVLRRISPAHFLRSFLLRFPQAPRMPRTLRLPMLLLLSLLPQRWHQRRVPSLLLSSLRLLLHCCSISNSEAVSLAQVVSLSRIERLLLVRLHEPCRNICAIHLNKFFRRSFGVEGRPETVQSQRYFPPHHESDLSARGHCVLERVEVCFFWGMSLRRKRRSQTCQVEDASYRCQIGACELQQGFLFPGPILSHSLCTRRHCWSTFSFHLRAHPSSSFSTAGEIRGRWPLCTFGRKNPRKCRQCD